jgi:predicted component of type VI protein secretion system
LLHRYQTEFGAVAASFDVERLAVQILGALDFDEHPEPLLLRIAILLRLKMSRFQISW